MVVMVEMKQLYITFLESGRAADANLMSDRILTWPRRYAVLLSSMIMQCWMLRVKTEPNVLSLRGGSMYKSQSIRGYLWETHRSQMWAFENNRSRLARSVMVVPLSMSARLRHDQKVNVQTA